MIAVTEALHDAVVRRVNWMTHPDGVFRTNCPLTDGQTTVDNLVTAFYRTANLLQEAVGNLDNEFQEMIAMPELLMDLIVSIQTAKTWDEVSTHQPDGCSLCEMFAVA